MMLREKLDITLSELILFLIVVIVLAAFLGYSVSLL